jgi:stress response protein YsnF
VGKEARVVEEVSLGKEVTEREQIVHDTVRNTEVDVEQIPTSTTTTGTSYDQNTRSNS